MTKFWGITSVICVMATMILWGKGKFQIDPLLDQTALVTVLAFGLGAIVILAGIIIRLEHKAHG